MNFLFLCVRMALFHFNCWKIISLDVEFWVDSILSFDILMMSFHCFLGSIISIEKSADLHTHTHTQLFLCHMWLSSGCFQDFIFGFSSLIIVCLGVVFFVFILFWILWAFWICMSTSFYKIWSVFSHYFFKYFFLPQSYSF